MTKATLEPGFHPSWMECSPIHGCGRWFSRLGDFDAHMVGLARRCLTGEELVARGIPFLRPEARRWSPETGDSQRAPAEDSLPASA